MPSSIPSFASAAASSGRQPQETSDYPEWSRRPNGATQTFRRSSHAMSSSHHRESSSTSNPATISNTGAYVPPHLNPQRNGGLGDMRYSKEQLLDIFHAQRDAHALQDGVASVFDGEWDPQHSNGTSANKWGRREVANAETTVSADVCWDPNGSIQPLNLTEMTEEEKEIFTTSVNSPLKAPNTATQKEGGSRDNQPTRRLSIPQGGASITGILSPTTSRGPLRRRDTLEEVEGTSLASPGLVRRRTDMRESLSNSITEEQDTAALPRSHDPPTPLKRINTAPFGSGNGSVPSSPWGPTSASGNVANAFGSPFGLGNTNAERSRPTINRGESRFRSLMTQTSSDDIGSPASQKPTLSGLGRLAEQAGRGNMHESEGEVSGSAALGGDSPPPHDFGTSGRRAFGDNSPFSGFGQQRTTSTYGQSQYSQTTQRENEDPNSPTYTNPYQSPEQHNARLDDMLESEESNLRDLHLPGLGGLGQPPSHQHGIGAGASTFEREAASSRGFAGLAGLGGLGGLSSPGGQWPSSIGTPMRERPGLYDPEPNLRSPRETHSPALAGLGSTGANVIPGLGAVGRGSSRLNSLLPNQMQRDSFSEGSRHGDEYLAGLGRDVQPGAGPGPMTRDTESPFSKLHADDLSDGTHSLSRPYSPVTSQQSGTGTGASQQHPNSHRMPLSIGGQPPAAQQKTMVMPDRIRWIYRDPQGNTQGPWSGLEMHDWYRAGFFSPELLVKKVEEPDFEPLAQMIRRIGNSREPFLVPQIGIPGPPSTGGTTWPSQPAGQAAAAQPPFASSFPTFGTTLTAEQQNALERRKQEEQYLMYRQKEHLAHQQQAYQKMQMGGHNMSLRDLNARSSAQSLNSQPSYGSITSPVGYQTVPHSNFGHQQMQGSQDSIGTRMTGGFGGLGPIGPGNETSSSHDPLAGLGDRPLGGASQFGPIAARQFDDGAHEQRTNQAAIDRARLEEEQLRANDMDEDEPLASKERLEEFQNLTGQFEEQEQPLHRSEQTTEHQMPPQSDGGLTLTEQVQKAASAKQSPLPPPKDAAPPPSTSPLPAPAARRNRNNVADAFAAESPASASPSVETPTTSLAPWARDPVEGHKQPSLKEIQEAEARRAAKQEELAAATRRAAFERELAAQPVAPAPGLPASSTWAAAENAPAAAVATSAWGNKATSTKTPTGSLNKKTLQQIQREEEALARKNRAAAAAASAANNQVAATAFNNAAAQSISAGKRYADLASKAASPGPSAANSGIWNTVGPSGKTKTAPAPAPPARSVSGTANTTAPTGMVSRPKATVTQARSTPTLNPMEELKKWVIGELRPEVNSAQELDNAMVALAIMPLDKQLIIEAIHPLSNTLDSRHFAEEYIRRRAAAEKGKFVSTPGSNPPSHDNKNGAGGWSEVARKGPAPTPAKEENSSFKMVAPKKKPGKK